MRRHLTLYSCAPQCIAVSIGHREGMRCEFEPKIWPLRLFQRNSIPGQPSVCTLVSFPSTCVKRTSRVDAARHLQAKPPVFCFDLSVFVCLARNSLSSHRYDKAALLQKTKEKWNQPKKKKTKVYNVKVKNNIKRLYIQVEWSDPPCRRVARLDIHIIVFFDAFVFKLFFWCMFTCLPNTSMNEKYFRTV